MLTRLTGMITLQYIQILNHYVAHLKLIWASLLGSAGKESTCNAGDPVWFLGREDSRYPLQYSWASLVAQLVKNSPAMRERPWFDPWIGKIPWRWKWQLRPVFLPGKFRGQRSLVGYSPWSHKESDTTERLTLYFIWQGKGEGIWVRHEEDISARESYKS